MKIVLNVVGYGLFIGAGIWAITGFYVSNVPTMVVMVIAGVVCTMTAEKMDNKQSNQTASQLGAAAQYQVQQTPRTETPNTPGFFDPNQ